MAINLNSNFSEQAALPLDDRTVVADTTARDAIASGRRYEGLQVYIVADETSYQLQGGLTNSDWVEVGTGGSGSGGGGMVIVATQSITASGTITLDAAIQQLLKVQGNSGAQSASITPFNTPPSDGTIVTLLGMSATNILKISYNDANEGCMLKGDCYLGLNDTLTLVYDLTAQRYWELSRN